MSTNALTERQNQIWLNDTIRLFYVDTAPSTQPRATILLIHGFPQTSYQFRHVMRPLAEAGFRVIAPDYRGHGYSSKPLTGVSGFTKKQMASDIFSLLTEKLDIKEKIHVVGLDIGGMIAHAYAAQFRDHVASVIWGECPILGSSTYEAIRHSRSHWHFDFQSHCPEFAAALVAGKERMYLKHFFDKQGHNQSAFGTEVVDFYTMQYSMPDAMRCGFLSYSAFELDAQDNRTWREEQGKINIPTMVLFGEGSNAVEGGTESMANEFYDNFRAGIVEHSGHWLAEENPEGFVKELLHFIEPLTS